MIASADSRNGPHGESRQERDDQASSCVDCGAEIWPEVDRAFSYGSEEYLCFGCAERRGGVFDADEDRWTSAPDLSGLPDERRPHA